MKDDILLNKLTIVIPTHQRPIALKRHLEYLKNYNKNLKILILDSSNKINKAYSHLDNYFYFKGKNANTKISKVLNKIKTEYVVSIGDDDFFIFNGLIKCLYFLEIIKIMMAHMAGTSFIQKYLIMNF